jgi:hypothetical protein
MMRPIVLTIILLVLSLTVLWPVFYPSPRDEMTSDCADAQLQYEAHPTREALNTVLRSCE